MHSIMITRDIDGTRMVTLDSAVIALDSMKAKYTAVTQELESAQNDIDLLNKEITALKEHAKNQALEYIAVAGEMQNYLEALPKVKAEAIEQAAKAVVKDMKSYDGSDVEIVHIDDLMEYAEMVRSGKA